MRTRICERARVIEAADPEGKAARVLFMSEGTSSIGWRHVREAMISAIPRFNDAPVFDGHPEITYDATNGKPVFEHERRPSEQVAWIDTVVWDDAHKGLIGTVHVFDGQHTEWFRVRLRESPERVEFSILADCEVAEDDARRITAYVFVESVDVVTRGANKTRVLTVTESAPPHPSKERSPMDDTKRLEELVAQVAEGKSRIGQLEDQLKQLVAERDGLKAKCTEHEAAQTAAAGELTKTKEQIDALTKERGALFAQVVEGRIATAKVPDDWRDDIRASARDMKDVGLFAKAIESYERKAASAGFKPAPTDLGGVPKSADGIREDAQQPSAERVIEAAVMRSLGGV